MDCPKRISSHITETASWKIFENSVPDEWMVRRVSERDYGIDGYVEIVRNSSQLTGDLCAVQIKGTENINWEVSKAGEKIAKVNGIKKSTILYWMNLPVPVFLILTDLASKQSYFIPVKHAVRGQYLKYKDEDFETMSLELDVDLELNKKVEKWLLFLAFYWREKNFEQFSNYIRGLLIHWQEYYDFIITNQERDCFMEVEYEQQLWMIHIYKTCEFLAGYFDIKWNGISLHDVYKKDRENWKDGLSLHEQSLGLVLKQLQPIYKEIIKKARDLIVEKQSEYWRVNDFMLWQMCLNLRVDFLE